LVNAADGYAERDAAPADAPAKNRRRSRRITVGADKGYDSEDFVSRCGELNVNAGR